MMVEDLTTSENPTQQPPEEPKIALAAPFVAHIPPEAREKFLTKGDDDKFYIRQKDMAEVSRLVNEDQALKMIAAMGGDGTLIYSIKQKMEPLFNFVVEQVPVTACDEAGHGALHWAAINDCKTFIKTMISKDSSIVSQRNKKGQLATHWAGMNTIIC